MRAARAQDSWLGDTQHFARWLRVTCLHPRFSLQDVPLPPALMPPVCPPRALHALTVTPADHCVDCDSRRRHSRLKRWCCARS